MLSSATKLAANVTRASAEHDVRSAARDLAADGREAVDAVADYANEAGQKVRSFVDRQLEQTRGVTDTIQDEITGNPVRSSIIALGVGFVLGALLTRR